MSDTSERFSVRDARLASAGLGERVTRFAWGCFGVGTLLFGGGMLGSALSGATGEMPLVLALPVVAGTLAVCAWPVLLAVGAVVGRGWRVEGTHVRVSSGSLAVENGTKQPKLVAGPFRQGAVLRDGVAIEDAEGRDLRLTMDPADAARLIDALDLEPEKRRFTFRWQNTAARIQSWIAGFFGFGMLAALPLVVAGDQPELIGLATSCGILAAPLLLTELASRFWAKRTLTVGLDGIEHRSRRGLCFLRFVDVRAVRSDRGELVVEMQDGTEERLLADPGDAAQRAAIEGRIREAMAVARAKAGTHSVAGALLERSGRTLSEWRDAAARMLTAATGFRDATVSADELSAVLDDATATAEQRVAAAIALGGLPEQRPRIRLAAEAVASPKLRVALEGVAGGAVSDDALADALEHEAARAAPKR